MRADEAAVWVDGYLATGLLETSTDLASLDRPGWWAVVGEFEGRWHLARFGDIRRVERLADAMAHGQWTWRGRWESSLGRQEYIASVETIRSRIAAGDVYQANLCRVLSAECGADLADLAVHLQRHHDAPFAAWMRLPDVEVVCASPERFIERNAGTVLSSPIKGTAPSAAGLTEKDRAENIMIVDLVRHDLAQVSIAGSVRTPRLLEVEEHPGLVHLVSDVEAQLAPGMGWSEILTSTFPPGSVSGAPKIAALDLLAGLEPVPRGPYCGAIGWVSGDCGRLAVGIRTFFRSRGSTRLHFGIGSGITWGSDAEREWQETVLKGERLIALAGGEWE
jgi:para-aminobenzoate synthetase component 1